MNSLHRLSQERCRSAIQRTQQRDAGGDLRGVLDSSGFGREVVVGPREAAGTAVPCNGAGWSPLGCCRAAAVAGSPGPVLHALEVSSGPWPGFDGMQALLLTSTTLYRVRASRFAVRPNAVLDVIDRDEISGARWAAGPLGGLGRLRFLADGRRRSFVSAWAEGDGFARSLGSPGATTELWTSTWHGRRGGASLSRGRTTARPSRRPCRNGTMSRRWFLDTSAATRTEPRRTDASRRSCVSRKWLR